MSKHHQQLHGALLLIEAEGRLARFLAYAEEQGIPKPYKGLENLFAEDYAGARIPQEKAEQLIEAAIQLTDRLNSVTDERELLFPECRELLGWLRQHFSQDELSYRLRVIARRFPMTPDTYRSRTLGRITQGRYLQTKRDRPGKVFWIFSAEQARYLRDSARVLKARIEELGRPDPKVYETLKDMLNENFPIKLGKIARILALSGMEISESTISVLRTGRARNVNGRYVLREEKAQQMLDILTDHLRTHLPQAA